MPLTQEEDLMDYESAPSPVLAVDTEAIQATPDSEVRISTQTEADVLRSLKSQKTHALPSRGRSPSPRIPTPGPSSRRRYRSTRKRRGKWTVQSVHGTLSIYLDFDPQFSEVLDRLRSVVSMMAGVPWPLVPKGPLLSYGNLFFNA